MRFLILLYLLLGLALPAAAMDVNGPLTRADLENLSADPSLAASGRIYLNTTSHKPEVRSNSAWLTILDTTSVISGQTLTGDTVSNYVDVTEQASAPSSPSSSTLRVYAKTDDKLYTLNSSGVETAVGSGSGEKNYLSKGTSTAAGWTASGAGITCTTATSNLPDASVGTALAVKGVSGSSAFCYYDFDVDQADYSKVLKLVWDQLPVTGYAASDFRVDVYSCTVAFGAGGACSGTLTRLPLSTDSSSVTALPAITGTVTPPTTYSAPNATAPHVQVQIGLNGTNTHQMNFAQVLTGPGTVVQSAVATGWYASTAPGGGWINTGPTNVSVAVNEQRTGSSVFLDYSITATGASASFTSLILNLPNGYALDPTYLPLTSSGTVAFERLGEGQVFRSGSNSGNLFAVNNGTSTTSILVYYEAGTAPDLRTNVTNTAPVSWTNVSAITYLHLRTKLLPIASMAGQGTVFLGSGQGDFAYNTSGITAAGASDTTSFGYGPAGAAIGSINSSTANSGTTMRVQFLTPNQIGDAYIIEVDRGSGGAYWIPVSQSDNICSAGCTQTTSSYGVAIDNIGSNWVDVSFGNMGRLPNGASYGAAGVSTWASISTWRWHMHRVHGAAPTGFANVSANAAGLVPATNTSLDNASATRLGLMQYTGANAPTITLFSGGGTLSSVTRAVFVPYQMNDGTWRLRLTVAAILSTTTRTSVVFSISGTTFKSGWLQASASGVTNVGGWANVYTVTGTGNIEFDHVSASTTNYYFGGDFELDSKPTWAY